MPSILHKPSNHKDAIPGLQISTIIGSERLVLPVQAYVLTNWPSLQPHTSTIRCSYVQCIPVIAYEQKRAILEVHTSDCCASQLMAEYQHNNNGK